MAAPDPHRVVLHRAYGARHPQLKLRSSEAWRRQMIWAAGVKRCWSMQYGAQQVNQDAAERKACIAAPSKPVKVATPAIPAIAPSRTPQSRPLQRPHEK